MLTILYRDENGREAIYEATHVHRIRHRPAAVPVGGNNYAPGVLVLGVEGMDDCTTIHYAERQTGNPASSDEDNPVVFVMNRHGKTVAHYFL